MVLKTEQNLECVWIPFTTVWAPDADLFLYIIFFFFFLSGSLYLAKLVRTSCAICFITVSINLRQSKSLLFVSIDF